MPRLIGAGTLVLVAWIVATILRLLVTKGLEAAKLDERLGGQIDGDTSTTGLAQTLGEAVYWLVFLLFLPAILGALGLYLANLVVGVVDASNLA